MTIRKYFRELKDDFKSTLSDIKSFKELRRDFSYVFPFRLNISSLLTLLIGVAYGMTLQHSKEQKLRSEEKSCQIEESKVTPAAYLDAIELDKSDTIFSISSKTKTFNTFVSSDAKERHSKCEKRDALKP